VIHLAMNMFLLLLFTGYAWCSVDLFVWLVAFFLESNKSSSSASAGQEVHKRKIPSVFTPLYPTSLTAMV